jgi:hypothetical protein
MLVCGGFELGIYAMLARKSSGSACGNKSMLKLVVKPLLLLAIVYALGGYIYYLGTGRFLSPGISWPSAGEKRPDLKQLSKMPALNSVKASETEEQEIYKWQDEKGVWHISNLPPESTRQGSAH